MYYLIIALLVASISQAAILRFNGTPSETVTIDKIKIPIYHSAWTDVPELNESLPVYMTGHGLYSKPLGFISVKIYYAVSYFDHPNGFQEKTNPIPELSGSRSFAIHFTYLRDLSQVQIRESFETMLLANNIDISDPEINQSLNDLDFDIQKGDTSVLVGSSRDRRLELLALESKNGIRTNTAENLAVSFWRVWFGVPSDSGMKKLKSLLAGLPERRALVGRH